MLNQLSDIRRTVLISYVKSAWVKTQGTMERQVWNAIRDFYNGETDAFGFIDDMVGIIDNQYGRAFREGARSVNVDPRTFTDEDLAVLGERIRQEQDYILGLAEDIDQARQTEAGVVQFKQRTGMWANRYQEVLSLARSHFGGRQLLEWVLGPTEQHCRDDDKPGHHGCLNLSGIVATANEWRLSGVHPQGSMLSCGGYQCQCQLKPTNKPPTDRKPPKAI